MNTVRNIIDAAGGLAHLRDHPLKLEREGYMPLCIEDIGPGRH